MGYLLIKGMPLKGAFKIAVNQGFYSVSSIVLVVAVHGSFLWVAVLLASGLRIFYVRFPVCAGEARQLLVQGAVVMAGSRAGGQSWAMNALPLKRRTGLPRSTR